MASRSSDPSPGRSSPEAVPQVTAPAEGATLRVDDTVAISRGELEFRATRSGGPGGQHVNTSSTRIELVWNVLTSSALGDQQRARLQDKLASRLDGEGNLRVVSATHRSQNQNKEEAERRLVTLILRALHVPRPRKRTRVPRAKKEERLRAKKQRSEVKKSRARVDRED